ncbi:type II toxin-antitoxin system VapC family toxin [Solihabitans fulvus]|uniref:Type II toxin-antitoxin system VapC family toxin n=1 Tax=Solihabitans fulvus TaxID=1892852 RepID=A0A5B2X0S0_9PSEU|nr:type II toxin-antitoxin system VapC family toxin [Solihabitans fulvus]KAA2256539.1 type II toxin-antitoxin system VapC family toxin [Solihabitans fulvus]
MIYLDSCAFVKLLLDEKESHALDAHLTEQNKRGLFAVSSELAKVEVSRTLIRHGSDEKKHEEAGILLSRCARLPIAPVLTAAAELPDPTLRSLDAIHLATAQFAGSALVQFITYDTRLGKAAQDAGLPLVTPGLN